MSPFHQCGRPHELLGKIAHHIGRMTGLLFASFMQLRGHAVVKALPIRRGTGCGFRRDEIFRRFWFLIDRFRAGVRALTRSPRQLLALPFNTNDRPHGPCV